MPRTDRFDPTSYKAEQVEAWDRVAQGWARWWPTFEDGGQALSDRLVELTEIAPGDAVLDVATGIGEPAMTAAHAVGPDGHVVGIDQAPRMLQIAQDRADTHGLANLRFAVEDAEDLGYDAAFDAALSRWGLMLVPDPGAVLRGLRQALKPGSRFAASVWSSADAVPFIRSAMEAVQEVLAPPEASAEAPGPFHLADPASLGELAEAAGFGEVETERLTIELAWASPDEFLAFHEAVSPPMMALADEPRETQAAARQRLKESAQAYADAGGRVRMPNETICVVGRA